MSNVTVRPIRPDETAAVGRLTLAAYDASGRVMDGPYRRWLGDPSLREGKADAVLVAVDPDGAVLGTVTFVVAGDEEFEHSPAHGDCGFRMLAVSPEAWGRGVGAALIDACIDRARDHGCRRLLITSMEWMTRAHGMYARRGFVRRPDLDVRYPAGVGYAYAFDLGTDVGGHFAAPGPAPDEPPWYEDVRR